MSRANQTIPEILLMDFPQCISQQDLPALYIITSILSWCLVFNLKKCTKYRIQQSPLSFAFSCWELPEAAAPMSPKHTRAKQMVIQQQNQSLLTYSLSRLNRIEFVFLREAFRISCCKRLSYRSCRLIICVSCPTKSKLKRRSLRKCFKWRQPLESGGNKKNPAE